MKILNNKIIILVFYLLISNRISALINGPPSITPGVNNTYQWAGSGFFSSWQTNNSNATFSSPTSLNSALVVTKNITDCKITITANYTYYDANNVLQNGYETKEIFIDPFLTGPAVIYPNENVNITCVDNCVNEDGHTLCYWNWSLNPNNTCTGCGNFQLLNSALVTCPSNGFPDSYVLTCNQFCSGGQVQYAPPAYNITVKLHNPSVSGLISVGCGGQTSNVNYSASQVTGANWYVWTVPSGWAINGNQNGSQISVTTNGANAGNVTVQAFASQGSAVKSDLVTFPVVCCISNIAVTDVVYSGTDQRQAANTITASNIITNQASGLYHAGQNVKLINGFKAIAGSHFHGYIEGCTGNYYRLIQYEGNEPEQTFNAQSENTTVGEKLNNYNIFPNPGEGKYTFSSKVKDSYEIKVYNIQSVLMKTVSVLERETEIGIENFAQGIYFFNIKNSKGETTNIKVIKQ
jgi:hypothetical protein